MLFTLFGIGDDDVFPICVLMFSSKNLVRLPLFAFNCALCGVVLLIALPFA